MAGEVRKRVSPVVERHSWKTETFAELAGELGELVLAGRLVIRGLADEGKKPIRPESEAELKRCSFLNQVKSQPYIRPVYVRAIDRTDARFNIGRGGSRV